MDFSSYTNGLDGIVKFCNVSKSYLNDLNQNPIYIRRPTQVKCPFWEKQSVGYSR